MKVNIDELQQICTDLFDQLKKNGHNEIDIDQDFYWSIPKEKKYDSYNEPEEFTIGQISDDYENLVKLKDKDNVVTYGFVWLASLLRVIGENVVE